MCKNKDNASYLRILVCLFSLKMLPPEKLVFFCGWVPVAWGWAQAKGE
jgi:hypothetical protein